jgi:hypothetical protein
MRTSNRLEPGTCMDQVVVTGGTLQNIHGKYIDFYFYELLFTVSFALRSHGIRERNDTDKLIEFG